MTVKEFLISSQEQQQPWVETPLRESYALSQAAGCRVFLKLENLQPSGSFKSRGIGYYILRRLEELAPSADPPHVFASSGGNAGLAAVHASRSLGLPCTVCVPFSTKPLMIKKLRAAGAHEVLQHGATFQDADAYLRKEIIPNATTATIYTPPFDHHDIWTGNSTVMHEIAAQLPGSKPDVVICSVGGGGLLNGVQQALDEYNMDTTVLAMETEGAESLNASFHAGELVSLKGITSQATSLGALRVTQTSLDIAQRSNCQSIVLPDAEAAMGCWRLADDEHIMVEMACGVNVALCYDGRLEQALGRKVRPDDKVVIVLCGGSNVTIEMLNDWRKEFAYIEERRDSAQSMVEVPSDATAPHKFSTNGGDLASKADLKVASGNGHFSASHLRLL